MWSNKVRFHVNLESLCCKPLCVDTGDSEDDTPYVTPILQVSRTTGDGSSNTSTYDDHDVNNTNNNTNNNNNNNNKVDSEQMASAVPGK